MVKCINQGGSGYASPNSSDGEWDQKPLDPIQIEEMVSNLEYSHNHCINDRYCQLKHLMQKNWYRESVEKLLTGDHGIPAFELNDSQNENFWNGNFMDDCQNSQERRYKSVFDKSDQPYVDWTLPNKIGFISSPDIKKHLGLDPSFSPVSLRSYLLTPEKPYDYPVKSPTTPPMHTYPWSPDEIRQYSTFSSHPLPGVRHYIQQMREVENDFEPIGNCYKTNDCLSGGLTLEEFNYPWNLPEKAEISLNGIVKSGWFDSFSSFDRPSRGKGHSVDHDFKTNFAG